MPKQVLRETIRANIAHQSAVALAEKSREICERVIASDLYARSSTILFYAPMPDEVDVMPIAQHALAAVKRVCFPAIDWQNRTMRALAVDSVDEYTFVIQKHGIREPASGKEIEPAGIDLVMVPGVAFTDAGDRLGRGAGFYDRYLASCPATRLGVCFREQIVDSMQAEHHDVPMETLVTDGRDMIVVTIR